MRIISSAIAFGIIAALLSLGVSNKQEKLGLKRLPRTPDSSLLIGWSPSLLAVTTAQETVRVQPEYEQVKSQDSSSFYPSISLDGKTLGYARMKAGNPERIVSIATFSLRTGQQTEYATGRYSGVIAISPDGSRLAYAGERPMEHGSIKGGDNHLHIVELKTGLEVPGPEVKSTSWPISASWSPDSRKLVFGVLGEIQVWDSDTGKIWQIANGDQPAWSPSGEWIAYLPGSSDPALKENVLLPGRWSARCLIVHPDGTARRVVIDWSRSKTPRFFVVGPVWSPDSKKILLNELADLETLSVDIYGFDLGTSKVDRLFKNSRPVLGWAK
jgi:Tol biopolymer transport system component